MASRRAQRRKYVKNACTGKIKYPDRDSAEAGLRVFLKDKSREGFRDRMCIYRCRCCDGWHKGHQISREDFFMSHESYTLPQLTAMRKAGKKKNDTVADIPGEEAASASVGGTGDVEGERVQRHTPA